MFGKIESMIIRALYTTEIDYFIGPQVCEKNGQSRRPCDVSSILWRYDRKPGNRPYVKTIDFTDFDYQKYQLISDENNEGVKAGTPWQKGPIPSEYAITGLGPIFVRIADISYFKAMLKKCYRLKK